MMTHRMKFWLFGGLTLAAVIAAGTLFGRMLPATGGSDQPFRVYPVVLALYAAVLGVAWLWWKRTDDLQQQGQLISWYWGGSCGALAMLAYLMTFLGRTSDITLGAFYMVMAQVVGFVAVWLIWVVRGRGHAE
ncbi:hypothetical protein [Erythrobacter sp. WG]|uniref:hypothetical protein n=1 Tax=Erythrobacter sp. WG TaxID=2985510 RepID=UPI0022715D46|nr:hypothetical protein [Erythrobacter sp. WG]MCX9147377.1 hypothetical protein [Erythrobacter sp. WG]